MLANSNPTIERCTNEIPQTSDPSACDAITCNAPATYNCEEGPRCAHCYRTYGGTLVIDADSLTDDSAFYRPPRFKQPVSALWIRANVEAEAELNSRRPIRDLGTLMSGVIDQITKGGAL